MMFDILIQILIQICLLSIWVPSRTRNMLFKSPHRISSSFIKQSHRKTGINILFFLLFRNKSTSFGLFRSKTHYKPTSLTAGPNFKPKYWELYSNLSFLPFFLPTSLWSCITQSCPADFLSQNSPLPLDTLTQKHL